MNKLMVVLDAIATAILLSITITGGANYDKFVLFICYLLMLLREYNSKSYADTIKVFADDAVMVANDALGKLKEAKILIKELEEKLESQEK